MHEYNFQDNRQHIDTVDTVITSDMPRQPSKC